MTRAQNFYIIGGITIMILVGLCPPWYYQNDSARKVFDGYNFFFAVNTSSSSLFVDWSRLLLIWGLIGLVTAWFAVAFPKSLFGIQWS